MYVYKCIAQRDMGDHIHEISFVAFSEKECHERISTEPLFHYMEKYTIQKIDRSNFGWVVVETTTFDM